MIKSVLKLLVNISAAWFIYLLPTPIANTLSNEGIFAEMFTSMFWGGLLASIVAILFAAYSLNKFISDFELVSITSKN